jgi:hypothetical protein
MSRRHWHRVLTFVLAAFFVVGSLSNLIAPGPVYAEYLKWGYPHWFHFVTGSLELTAALLLLRAPSRLSGAALGFAVMIAALVTVLVHGEYAHAVPPCVAAAWSVVVGWIARNDRSGATSLQV